MKTIKQWFETFEDAKIRKRALENTLKEDIKWEAKDLTEAIYSAFIWSKAKEGFDFWLEVKNHDNPASVKFDEVKHLIKND